MLCESVFGQSLINALTTRERPVPFSEMHDLVTTILKPFQAKIQGFGIDTVNSRLVITRLVSEGYVEVDLIDGCFVLSRPTLLSLSGSQKSITDFALVGASTERISSLLSSIGKEKDISRKPNFDLPRKIYQFTHKPELYQKLINLGLNIIGDENVAASDVLISQIKADSHKTIVSQDRIGYYIAHKAYKLSDFDFKIKDEVNLTNSSTGFYILTNRAKGKPVIECCMIKNGVMSIFPDWRWFYSEYQTARKKPVDLFYNPMRKVMGVFAQGFPNPRYPTAQRDNWIPWQLARSLGASAGASSITVKHIQEHNGHYREAYIYPNISTALALACHNTLGFNKLQPLRILHY